VRVHNPDEAERLRDLRPMKMMAGHFHPIDGQLSNEGVWRVLQEHQSASTLPATITRADVDEVVRQELVQEAWAEVAQTDEIKRNLEKLQPIIERIGY
jgi:hypothetical protein